MPKIEVPASVPLYVQWRLHPFPTPNIREHSYANSKWALAEAKKLLEENAINERDVKLSVQYNGIVLMEILQPEVLVEDGKEMWDYVLSFLEKSNDIVSISILVNNDITSNIASNLADRVPRPWYTGYRGSNSNTLIYHK